VPGARQEPVRIVVDYLVDSVIRLFGLLLAGYAALCLVLYLFQDRLIFLPRSLLLHPTGAHVSPVTVASGSVSLRGWVVNPASQGPLLVYFGGNAEELSGLVQVFARLDATTVLVNYRGFGESEGSPSAADLIADARTVVDVIQRRLGGQRPLILFGRSIGSGIAAHAASAADVDALILMSPYRTLQGLAAGHMPWVPVSLLLRHHIDTVAALDELPARLLVLYGEQDHIIPTEESRAVVDLLEPAPRVVEFQAGHNVPLTHPDIWPHIERFVADTARAAGGAGRSGT